MTDTLDVGADDSKEDLATILRRAALDVAVAASGQAADRLGAREGGHETAAEPEAEAASSSSR
ncbi:MAG TPA: hypothetical protein VLD16_16685 [Gaiellaceae bacterium]|nr:hypothetical protein [Gaiellaceae bacterium]